MPSADSATLTLAPSVIAVRRRRGGRRL